MWKKLKIFIAHYAPHHVTFLSLSWFSNNNCNVGKISTHSITSLFHINNNAVKISKNKLSLLPMESWCPFCFLRTFPALRRWHSSHGSTRSCIFSIFLFRNRSGAAFGSLHHILAINFHLVGRRECSSWFGGRTARDPITREPREVPDLINRWSLPPVLFKKCRQKVLAILRKERVSRKIQRSLCNETEHLSSIFAPERVLS